MRLEQILTELKVKNVKSSTSPRNALVSAAMVDIDNASDSLRSKLRNSITVVIRKDKKLWVLRTKTTMYKMVTVKEIE